MKRCRYRNAVTLVELLIVVAVIVILATMVIGVAARIDTQGKERLAKGTIAILTGALGQFRDYEYSYKVAPALPIAEQDFYRGLAFPLDCNDFDVPSLQATLSTALGGPAVVVGGGTHLNQYSGSEVLYFFLSRVPTSRKTLDRIDESLVTSEDSNKQPMSITVGVTVYPLLRIVDPWGTTLRYDYYNRLEITDPLLRQRSKRTFPVIRSAGADRVFGTIDDIISKRL